LYATSYSGYEGWELKGKVKTTILRGQVAIDRGDVKIKKGYGQLGNTRIYLQQSNVSVYIVFIYNETIKR
jgi:hypothetical protein